MNCKEIIEKYLKDNSFDGLYHMETNGCGHLCGCEDCGEYTLKKSVESGYELPSFDRPPGIKPPPRVTPGYRSKSKCETCGKTLLCQGLPCGFVFTCLDCKKQIFTFIDFGVPDERTCRLIKENL